MCVLSDQEGSGGVFIAKWKTLVCVNLTGEDCSFRNRISTVKWIADESLLNSFKIKEKVSDSKLSKK